MYFSLIQLTCVALFCMVGHNVHGKLQKTSSHEELKNMNISCGKTSAVLTYTGDPQAVVAFGSNKLCYFEPVVEDAKFVLKATYEGHDSKDCVMMKRAMGQIYHLKIQARYSSPHMESEGDETAILSCNFEVMLSSQANTINLIDPVLKPIVVEDERSGKAESTFSLSVCHEDGSPLPEASTVGTNVELIALMRPAPNEVAYQVIMCNAVMPDEGLTIPIIIDGCGTGDIFSTDKGFVRYHLFANSPKFGLFRAVKTRALQFRCEFLVCPEECDRYSCPSERLEEKASRKKRSTEVTSKRVWVETKIHRIYLRGEAQQKTLTYNDLIMNSNDSLNRADMRSDDATLNQARLIHQPQESKGDNGGLALPVKFLVIIVVGGVVSLLLVVLGIWLGWRYATRSLELPSRSGSRTISEPVVIPPAGAMPPRDYGDPFYSMAL